MKLANDPLDLCGGESEAKEGKAVRQQQRQQQQRQQEEVVAVEMAVVGRSFTNLLGRPAR